VTAHAAARTPPGRAPSKSAEAVSGVTTFAAWHDTESVVMKIHARCRWLLPLILSACEGAIDSQGAASRVGGAGSPDLPGPSGPINPGRVVAHRLNRVEYDNTIRDLIGVDLKPSSQFGFPDDNYVEGFDNNALSLSASPLLLEKYQMAVDAIVARVLDVAPANAALRSRVLSCDPQQAGAMPCATQILSTFATRAFRRPVSAAEIAPYTALLATATSVGDGFEQGIAAALKALLLSPKFLFRVEHNPPAGRSASLDGYEIATRLSYFVWSSMPDDELLQRAADASLQRPDEIQRQVARMLRDPKADALVTNLAGEWLGTRELAVKEITLSDFQLDDAMRDAIGQEARLFLGELLSGNHPLNDLLGVDFAFVNQRLATHYGFSNAAALGADFQRVTVPDLLRRGGVLTQANFLTVQSQRDRTSPTRRGKWVSENLLCVIVPPPPPKIPELVPNDQTMPTSTRERLEAHRRKGSTCNGCHQFMDPLGLAFEHFDTVGRYRDSDLGAAIDASGEVPVTAVPFDGALGLATVLKDDPRLAECVLRKFLTYALGRSLSLNPAPGDTIDDTAALADLKARLLASGNQMSQLVSLVAQSPTMTMRVGEL
jgi:Protein of unknown function (DUF1592)/Protein of unknown function (DUF1588)/Protein of unknown function (DUF1595)/Protein of unknown function (DUF1587)/Protein of unknown function (DUF1585)